MVDMTVDRPESERERGCCSCSFVEDPIVDLGCTPPNLLMLQPVRRLPHGEVGRRRHRGSNVGHVEVHDNRKACVRSFWMEIGGGLGITNSHDALLIRTLQAIVWI